MLCSFGKQLMSWDGRSIKCYVSFLGRQVTGLSSVRTSDYAWASLPDGMLSNLADSTRKDGTMTILTMLTLRLSGLLQMGPKLPARISTIERHRDILQAPMLASMHMQQRKSKQSWTLQLAWAARTLCSGVVVRVTTRSSTPISGAPICRL